MVSADEGWVVGGTRFNPTESVILHYQHGQWTRVASPITFPLNDIAMVSSAEGWAVGGDFFRVPLNCPGTHQTVMMNALLHYANGTWTRIPAPTDEALQGISMVAADDGWIVGWNTFLRYANGMWEAVKPVQ
jgi:hypothetical protein